LLALSKDRDLCAAILRNCDEHNLSAGILSSGREGGGIASVSALRKSADLPSETVLFLLWAREFVLSEGWEELFPSDLAKVWDYALSGSYMLDEFAQVSHDLANSDDVLTLTSKTTLERIDALFGILFPDADRNARERRDFDHNLLRGKIRSALQLKDDWNDRTILIETDQCFVYFNWSTSA
jgi:hypothetical protein